MDQTADVYLKALAKEMAKRANTDLAIQQSKYLKSLFPFFGLKSPERKEVIRTFENAHGKVPLDEIERVAKLAYQYKEREMHYFAMELIVKNKKKLEAKNLNLVEWLVTHNAWWDTVELLAAHAVGMLNQKFTVLRSDIDSWIEHENMWLRRSALLHQLGYKEKTDTDKLFAFCLNRAHEKEFFIRKAIGWALREYSKINPQAVEEFVHTHANLSGLSKREALKHINKKR